MDLNKILRIYSNKRIHNFISINENVILNYNYFLFFFRNLLLIKPIFKRVFKRLIIYRFAEVKKYFKKSRLEYIRGYEYIRYIAKGCHAYLEQYKITGTLNLEGFKFYGNRKIYPSFQEDLLKFKKLLVDLVNKKESKTFYKFGDGDYRFLKKIPEGSAKPGKRALSKSYDEIDISKFMSGVLKNDFIMVDIKPYVRKMYYELFSNRKVDFPSDYGHALVANKWFFKTFNGKIGLIGAKEKIKLIEELIKYKEYQDYLAIEKFNDYIYIPQKFAADDVEKLEKDISKQLENSTSEIFLLGFGHVKSALLYKLKKYKKAVYVDVGGAIDAIAGIINVKRMYMGYWTNFQIKNFDFSNIDFMRYQGWGKHIILDSV